MNKATKYLLCPNCFACSVEDEHHDCPWCGNDVEMERLDTVPKGVMVLKQPE
jgi:hypothetical protein